MKKFILLLVLGIACSGIYAQIDESSFSFNYSADNSELALMDTINTYGQLNIEFDLEDTLHCKGVRIEILDDHNNTIYNEFFSKNDLESSGSYSNPTITKNLGSFVSSNSYTLRLYYIRINGISLDPISKSISQ